MGKLEQVSMLLTVLCVLLASIIIISGVYTQYEKKIVVSKETEDKVDAIIFKAAFPLMKYHEPIKGETNGNTRQD